MGRGKSRGHWCWACDRVRSNESFSGKGHARHVCKQCWKKGQAYLDYQRALRNMEQCLTDDGLIARKHRRHFYTYFQHSDRRIREAAKEIELLDLSKRLEYSVNEELEGALAELQVDFSYSLRWSWIEISLPKEDDKADDEPAMVDGEPEFWPEYRPGYEEELKRKTLTGKKGMKSGRKK